MSGSSRVELLLAYKRDAEGCYSGTVARAEGGAQVMIAELACGKRADWVKMVHRAIMSDASGARVVFAFDGEPDARRHAMDDRTVEKIKSGALSLEDLILEEGDVT